jgi:DNA-binding FadR family transcriptional regulator
MAKQPAKAASSAKRKKFQEIAEHIELLIFDGRLSVGDKIPSETDLAHRFGASRPVVREALARLREDGVIISRQGSGSYVVRKPDRAVLTFAPVGSIADIRSCFEFRADFESAAAAVAAERRQPADIARIRAAYDALEVCVREARLGVDDDIRLHEADAGATHSQYYVSVQASLRDPIARGMNVLRNLSLRRPAARLRLVQDEHAAIVAAIERGRAEQARSAMRTHILNASDRMFESA